MKKELSIGLLIRNNEIIIASGLMIFIVIILTAYFLLPNYFKANQIFTETGQLRTRLSSLNKKEDQLGRLNPDFYNGAFPKIRQVLPSEKDFVSLFSTFDTLQSKTGVTIVRTDFQFGVVSTSSGLLSKAPGSPAYIVPMTIEILGDREQINKFLGSLTDLSGRLITVEDVQWNLKIESGIDALINSLAYFYPLPATIGSLDSPLPELNEKQAEIHNAISEKVVLVNEDEENANIQTGKKDLFR